MAQRSSVVGVFEDRYEAQRAIEQLRAAGFREDQIGYAMRGSEGDTPEGDTKAGDLAVGGAVTGTVLGGLIGAAATALIPGVGPILAGGVLAGALTGAATGAAAGGIAGALVGMGIPKDEAEYYESEFKSGRAIVTVKADGRYDEAARIIQSTGGRVGETAAGARGRGPTRSSEEVAMTSDKRERERYTEGEDRVELREERLRAEKQPVEAGEVTVGKKVVSEEQELEVPVRREEAIIERRATEKRPASGQIGEEDEIRVPLREEQVRVEKEPVVTEEITVGKRQVQDTKRVSDTVRREEAEIDEEGQVERRS